MHNLNTSRTTHKAPIQMECLKIRGKGVEVSLSTMLLFFFFLPGCKEENVEGFKFANPYTVEVIGEDYEWKIRYPGKDGVFNTQDDIWREENFVLPANTEVRLIFKSKDLLYFIELPELEKNGMAVPGLESPLDLKTTSPMKLQFRGDQMCGFSHESLIKSISVKSKKGFIAYLTD